MPRYPYKQMGTGLDREFRNEYNQNLKDIESDIKTVKTEVSEKVFDEIVDSAKLVWKEPVNTSNNLPSGASEGDTIMTRDTGKVYRFNGSAWVEIQQIDAGPVNEVDTRLTSQLAENVKKDEVFSNTYTPPIELVLNDFSGYNQPFHPSVIYIPNGFAGYKYWLVQSPYPIGGLPSRDRWEVPVVYKSNNGIDWISVADPLDDLTQSEIDNGDYMSDPHILFREDTGTLEVWYRLTKNTAGMPTNIIRKTTRNGVTWTAREELVTPKLNTASDFMRSPAIIWDNTNKIYRAWYQNDHGLYYNTSADGKMWGQQVRLTLDFPHTLWHLDVNFYNNTYHLISYSKIDDDLVHYTSSDGLKFTKDRTLLSVKDKNPLYANGLYRSVSLLDENNKVRIYFSAVNSSNVTKIGLIIADNYAKIQPIQRINATKIVTATGYTVDEKLSELHQVVRVFEVDTFNALTPYSDFPKGNVTQNIIRSTNAAGTPNGIGGLLITDWTSEKSSDGFGTDNLVFQTFRETGTGRIYTRSTTGVKPFDWTKWFKATVSDDYEVVYNTSNIALANGASLALAFDTRSSVSGRADFVKINQDGRIEFKEAGNYFIVVKIVFSANPNGVRRLTIGSAISRVNASQEQETIIDVSTFVNVSANSTLKLEVAQTSGATLNVLGGSSILTSVRIKKM